MNTFTQRLKELRKARGRTQAEIGAAVGVLRSTYGEYERGAIMPPADKLQKLADYFGVTVDYLVGKSDFKFRNEAKPLDISANIAMMLSYLQNNKSSLIYNGSALTAQERAFLLCSLQGVVNQFDIIRG